MAAAEFVAVGHAPCWVVWECARNALPNAKKARLGAEPSE